jgi:hypothetical protein
VLAKRFPHAAFLVPPLGFLGLYAVAYLMYALGETWVFGHGMLIVVMPLFLVAAIGAMSVIWAFSRVLDIRANGGNWVSVGRGISLMFGFAYLAAVAWILFVFVNGPQ